MGCHSLPGDLPNPGIEPRSPSLQADSSELPGKLPSRGEQGRNLILVEDVEDAAEQVAEEVETGLPKTVAGRRGVTREAEFCLSLEKPCTHQQELSLSPQSSQTQAATDLRSLSLEILVLSDSFS